MAQPRYMIDAEGASYTEGFADGLRAAREIVARECQDDPVRAVSIVGALDTDAELVDSGVFEADKPTPYLDALLPGSDDV